MKDGRPRGCPSWGGGVAADSGGGVGVQSAASPKVTPSALLSRPAQQARSRLVSQPFPCLGR